MNVAVTDMWGKFEFVFSAPRSPRMPAFRSDELIILRGARRTHRPERTKIALSTAVDNIVCNSLPDGGSSRAGAGLQGKTMREWRENGLVAKDDGSTAHGDRTGSVRNLDKPA